MFGGFPISSFDLPEDIKDKKMGDLTPDEKKKILRNIKENSTEAEISPSIRSYMDKQDEIDGKKEGIRDMKHLANGSSPEALAAIRNGKGSDKKLENTLK